MSDRTQEQIIDEVTFAIACVYQHYGPELSTDGLRELRRLITDWHPPQTDSSYRVDVYDSEEMADFHQRIKWGADWERLEFGDIVSKSR